MVATARRIARLEVVLTECILASVRYAQVTQQMMTENVVARWHSSHVRVCAHVRWLARASNHWTPRGILTAPQKSSIGFFHDQGRDLIAPRSRRFWTCVTSRADNARVYTDLTFCISKLLEILQRRQSSRLAAQGEASTSDVYHYVVADGRQHQARVSSEGRWYFPLRKHNLLVRISSSHKFLRGTSRVLGTSEREHQRHAGRGRTPSTRTK